MAYFKPTPMPMHACRVIFEPPSDRRELYDEFMVRLSVPINFMNIGYLVLLK